MAIVATPSYALAPKVTMFVPPAALASLGLALVAGRQAIRFLAWVALAALVLCLIENVAVIVWHEIGWATRQGASGADAVLSGLGASVSRAPYWIALAFPAGLAAACLKIARPCPPSTSSRR